MSLPHVVLEFLDDRRCAPARAALGPLFANPNLADGFENHLRAAALLYFKPAWPWLGLRIVRVARECWEIQSAHQWVQRALTLQDLQHGLNAFDDNAWSAAQQFLANQTCANADTLRMLKGIKASSITRAATSPRSSIWVEDPPGQWRFVDGNARLHALILGLQTGQATSINGWTGWFRT